MRREICSRSANFNYTTPIIVFIPYELELMQNASNIAAREPNDDKAQTAERDEPKRTPKAILYVSLAIIFPISFRPTTFIMTWLLAFQESF